MNGEFNIGTARKGKCGQNQDEWYQIPQCISHNSQCLTISKQR